MVQAKLMRGRGVWPAAVLLAAAATAREVVRLGYFTEAQPFEVACARGWFEGELRKSTGGPTCRGGRVPSRAATTTMYNNITP